MDQFSVICLQSGGASLHGYKNMFLLKSQASFQYTVEIVDKFVGLFPSFPLGNPMVFFLSLLGNFHKGFLRQGNDFLINIKHLMSGPEGTVNFLCYIATQKTQHNTV